MKIRYPIYREKQIQYVKQYRLTEKGREVGRNADRKYYKNHREKICEKNKQRRQKQCNTLVGRLREVYRGLNRRCNEPSNDSYKRYGGRGIKNNFKHFDEFLAHIILDLEITELKQIKELQIDRIDNDGHYEPGNIRFVTAKVNCNNRNTFRERDKLGRFM